MSLLVLAAAPARAEIVNSATASGSYAQQVVQTDAAILELAVEPAEPAMAVEQAVTIDVAGGEDAEAADGGDTLTLAVTVTNTGNITLRDVAPTDAALLAGGTAVTGSLAAFEPASAETIAPGEAQTFTAVYSLSAEDIYRAAGTEGGMAATASAAGTSPAGQASAEASPASAPVAANPRLVIAKDATIAKGEGNTGEDLEAGDLVTYTYTVTNTGNVAIDGITVADEHEGVVLNSADVASAQEGPFDETLSVEDPLGVSADESGVNGSWDVLGAGGAVTFTYNHTVTQAEFEAQ